MDNKILLFIPFHLVLTNGRCYGAIDLCHSAAILSQEIKSALFMHG